MTKGHTIAVFGSSRTEPGSQEWNEAVRVGSRLAEAGLAVITGGYGGTMEAASFGASHAGGHVLGVTAPDLFTSRPTANRYVTSEIHASSLTERIGILTSRADGVIVLPGSIGTAAELVVSWNLNHVARRNTGERLPTVSVGQAWRDLISVLTEEMGAFGGDVHAVNSAEEAVDWLLQQPEIRRLGAQRL